MTSIAVHAHAKHIQAARRGAGMLGHTTWAVGAVLVGALIAPIHVAHPSAATSAAVGAAVLALLVVARPQLVDGPAIHAVPLRDAPPTRARGGHRRTEAGVDGWQAARRELERSRRYEHPMGLLRLTAAGSPELGWGSTARSMQARLASSSSTALGQLRGDDVRWQEGDHCYLLLPETSREACDAVAQRLLADEPWLGLLDIRVVEFPRDGLTLAALLAALDRAVPGADERAAV